jgi:hypothetical protein
VITGAAVLGGASEKVEIFDGGVAIWETFDKFGKVLALRGLMS